MVEPVEILERPGVISMSTNSQALGHVSRQRSEFWVLT